ncbi:MAG TPA: hypothetical protein PKZ92_02505 [Candidatus Woesebacteria bacterium]|nr:hypothetical protein [Candidatus Shapirobacteria bacterium]HOR02106.1 hypothetical protein [Candidatus Woesebacteria bacterium]
MTTHIQSRLTPVDIGMRLMIRIESKYSFYFTNLMNLQLYELYKLYELDELDELSTLQTYML